MLKDIIEVNVLPHHRIFIRFEDGVKGEIDIAAITSFTGIFASLRDDAVFKLVAVNSELGTVQWPNGADLDPDVLYAALVGDQIKLVA
jgi:hypothetical protein